MRKIFIIWILFLVVILSGCKKGFTRTTFIDDNRETQLAIENVDYKLDEITVAVSNFYDANNATTILNLDELDEYLVNQKKYESEVYGRISFKLVVINELSGFESDFFIVFHNSENAYYKELKNSMGNPLNRTVNNSALNIKPGTYYLQMNFNISSEEMLDYSNVSNKIKINAKVYAY